MQNNTATISTATVDEDRLQEFVHRMVGDFGAAISGALIVIGDRLGLYRALAASSGMTPATLSDATGTNERYIEEWLAAQAAAGYVEYDAELGVFSMTPEQAMVLADPDSPVLLTGGYYNVASVYSDEARIADVFRTGEGFAWGEHHPCLFCGTEKFFRSSYNAHLVSSWLPALDGVTGKLERGARVADVGCGHGAATIIMAQAYPNSQFFGFDYHEHSIAHAREAAREAGVTNITFEVATAQAFPGTYDLVCFFDCLHDMGDPVGAARQVRRALAADGTWMIVEPYAGDRLEDNLHPVGQVYYGFSATVCTPSALSQEGGRALGTQAGEARLRGVVEEGGFSRFRRATETPLNLILEARP